MASEQLCPKCKQPVHPTFMDRHLASCPGLAVKWNCPMCTFENDAASNTCVVCAQGKRPNKNPGKWNCKHCTYENPSTAQKCQMCGSDKSISIIKLEKEAKKEPKRHDNILNRRVDLDEDRLFEDIRSEKPAKKVNINEQYRVDPRERQKEPDVGNHPWAGGPGIDADVEIDLYANDDSDDIDVVEKQPPRRKHRPRKEEEKSDERIDDIDFEWDNMNKPKQRVEAAPENDADTLALIQQLLKAELCQVCNKEQGFDLHNDGKHRCCANCGNKYLMSGLKKEKWKRKPLTCPIANCEKPFPQSLITSMKCTEVDKSAILKAQDHFCKGGMRIITCPKCDAQYEAESASASEAKQKIFKEFGLDNKPLSPEAMEHKGRCRFRCPDCTTVFCGDCGEMPYHIGFTCEGWEEYQRAKQCRFCGAQITNDNLAPYMEGGDGLMWVCRDDECLTKREHCCGEILPCGHLCRGIKGETDHPRCLEPECNPPDAVVGDDFCNICWVESLSQAPCVQLNCGHFFHYQCIQTKVSKRWPAARITFKFMDCPLCNQEIQHPKLKRFMKSSVRLKKEVSKQALERLRVEGLDSDERLKDPNSKYYNNKKQFALDRLAFYICFKCKKPYFGGMRRCEEAGMPFNSIHFCHHDRRPIPKKYRKEVSI